MLWWHTILVGFSFVWQEERYRLPVEFGEPVEIFRVYPSLA
jgi:hypothetical protein